VPERGGEHAQVRRFAAGAHRERAQFGRALS